MHLGKQVVVEEGSQASNVHQACRAGRIPHSHSVCERVVGAVFDPGNLADIAVVRVNLGIDLLLRRVSASTTSCREVSEGPQQDRSRGDTPLLQDETTL